MAGTGSAQPPGVGSGAVQAAVVIQNTKHLAQCLHVELGLYSHPDTQAALSQCGRSPWAPWGPPTPRQSELVVGQRSGEEVWLCGMAAEPLSVPGPILRVVGSGLYPFLGLEQPGRASPEAETLSFQGKPEDAGPHTLKRPRTTAARTSLRWPRGHHWPG